MTPSPPPGSRLAARRNVLRGSTVLLATAFAAAGARRAEARPDATGPSIGILLYDGFSLLDPTGPAEILSRVPDARVTMIGERPGPIRTDTGDAALVAERAFGDVDHVDVLLIPGGDERGFRAVTQNNALLDWIRRIDGTSRWTTSVCTGALILAAAGLLTGHSATTYWAAGPYLESTFGVRYLPQRYVRSGKFITAAGVSAGIDMALYLAAQLTDEDTARAIQLGIEYDPQPPFDAGNATRADADQRARAQAIIARSQR
ncbi:DJ-1/PfpI family protein [Nocardia sp. BMG51109]|uniref:DJ-1/PfpI family protein n=1 Tax=Nocardia sp. BMG51109 TaxID=1056816 RepID=UPI0006876DDB|nr:DJ-1/PfpI family protein [Nocardia sp. BMG51109]